MYIPGRYSLRFFSLILTLGVSGVVQAEGRGQGGIVIKNDVVIYASDTGDKEEPGVGRVQRGFPVGGVTLMMATVHSYLAEIENGRAHIIYLGDGKTRSKTRHRAWINPADVAFFTYECGCGKKSESCAPVVTAGWTSERWNPCYQEAYDKKLAELKTLWERGGPEGSSSPTAVVPSPASGAAEKPLTNGDVVALLRAGLGDALILSKIQQSPNEALDVSTDGLIQLSKDGVPKAILNAMIKRVGQRK